MDFWEEYRILSACLESWRYAPGLEKQAKYSMECFSQLNWTFDRTSSSIIKEFNKTSNLLLAVLKNRQSDITTPTDVPWHSKVRTAIRSCV